MIAPPRQASPLLPPSSSSKATLREAERARARRRLGRALAGAREEHHLHIGERVHACRRPTPTACASRRSRRTSAGRRARSTINAADYARAWGSARRERVQRAARPRRRTAPQVAREIRARARRGSACRCRRQRSTPTNRSQLSRQGLARLTQIATLILAAAVLAMAAAIGAMIWQRRPRLAKLKLEGFSPRRAVARRSCSRACCCWASAASTGALFGLLGQQLLDRALSAVDQLPGRQLGCRADGAYQPRARHRSRASRC